ncbi:hypothetical protein [Roseovarius aestuariivivens]|uniref:hypothetical protein n=1 Tax=Roseovarius aestuariivivens TaxID=1888910 RepID=UPI0010810967|nr:hypothetical protein [Roseovarius aestuariivivens]
MAKHVLRALAAFFAVMWTVPVWAESPACAERSQIVDRLQDHYAEMHAGSGLQARNEGQALVEVWASKETGTFTVMLTSPEGVSCVLATGTNWQFADPLTPVSGQAS